MRYEPKVSVIMPLYNSEVYLRETMETVMRQTLKDIEIICVNDGSTDNTLQILQSLQAEDDRIHVFSQANQGPGLARNYGISKAVGKYVCFMDGDDLLELEALEKLYMCAEKHCAEIVFFSLDTFMSQTGEFFPVRIPLPGNVPDKEVFSGEQVKESFRTFGGYAGNIFLLRDFICKNHLGFLDQYIYEDDYFQATSIASAKRICVLEERLLHYRRFSQGISYDYSRATTEAPRCYYHIKKWLLENGKWDIFEADFMSFVTESIFTNLYRVGGDAREKYYNCLRTEILQNLGFAERPLSLYRKSSHFFEIQRIMSMTYEQYSAITAPGLSAKKHKPELIVSLTSYPKRIATAHKAIYQILAQSEKADRVILWLSEEDFPAGEVDLPQELLNLREYGLEIEWCASLRSYQKLIPALCKYPDAVIVTADDDIMYNTDWLHLLWDAYQRHPNHIHCHRPAMLEIKGGEFHWTTTGKRFYPTATYLHRPISHAGILYPPHSLHPDAHREDLFLNYSPTNDDLWFWFMAIRNGVRIEAVEHNIPTPKHIAGTQGTTLSQLNDGAEGFFARDLGLLLTQYPEVRSALHKESQEGLPALKE